MDRVCVKSSQKFFIIDINNRSDIIYTHKKYIEAQNLITIFLERITIYENCSFNLVRNLFGLRGWTICN